MAFRERNPNALGPIYNNDNTWKKLDSKQDAKVGRPKPAISKENTIHPNFESFIEGKNTSVPRKVYNSVEGINRLSIRDDNNRSESELFTPCYLLSKKTLGPSTQNISFNKTLNNGGHKLCNGPPEGFKQSLVNTNDDCSFPYRNLKKKQDTSTSNQGDSDRIPELVTKLNYSRAVKKNLPDSPDAARIPFVPEKKSVRSLEDYGRLLHRIGESNAANAAEHSESVLREMLDYYSKGIHMIQPDGACYNSVIHTYAKAGKAEKAESVLRLMFKNYTEGNEKAEPNVRVYTNVLHAWRKAKAPNAPERCEAILKEMYELSDTGLLKSCKPDTFAVTVLLHCWTESNRKNAATRTESIFRKMKNRFLDGEQAQCPDSIAYSIVLNKFAQDSMYDAAEAILFEMVDDYLSGNDCAKPRIRNFNTVLAMYSKSSASNAPQRAEHVVSRIRSLSMSGVLDVHPDEYTYSLLLKTWVTSYRKDGINQAVNCLQWMRSLSEAGDSAATPDIVKYTTIISAYARVGNASRAADMLETMIQDFLDGNELAKPDYKAFDIVVSACVAGSITGHSGWLAEKIVNWMWELHCSGKLRDVKPKAGMYKSLIICYKKASNAEKAEQLLREMQYYHQNGKLDAGPSKKLFQTVINAWHESARADKQIHLQSLRVDMSDRFGRRGDDDSDTL